MRAVADVLSRCMLPPTFVPTAVRQEMCLPLACRNALIAWSLEEATVVRISLPRMGTCAPLELVATRQTNNRPNMRIPTEDGRDGPARTLGLDLRVGGGCCSIRWCLPTRTHATPPPRGMRDLHPFSVNSTSSLSTPQWCAHCDRTVKFAQSTMSRLLVGCVVERLLYLDHGSVFRRSHLDTVISPSSPLASCGRFQLTSTHH